MTKKPRKDKRDEKPIEPSEEEVRQDGDLVEGDAPNTRNDAAQLHGFFTFSGELADEETRTDVFREEADAAPAPIEEPVADPDPEPEPELAPAEEDVTQTDAFDLEEEADTDPETRIEVEEEIIAAATETELHEPAAELSYLAPAEDQTAGLDEATLTDFLAEESLFRPAEDETVDLAPTPDADETASLPEIPELRKRPAPGDETASLSEIRAGRHAPLVVPPEPAFTETKPDPELEELPRAAPRVRRDRRTAPRRRRRERKPSLLSRLKTVAGKVLRKPRLRLSLKGIGAVVKEGIADVGAVIRPKRAEIRINKNAEWWRRTTVEIAALFALVVPVEIVASGGQVGSFGAHPHPYWIIVLPMAGARGVVAGLLSAAVASILYVIGAMQAIRPDYLGDLFTYKTMLEPLLFFGVGFFAGELHDELALRYRKMERLLNDVQERNQRLRQERDVLGDANRELERRIVDDSVQFGNLIVAATRIENSDRNEVFEVALELVEEHCGAAASILLLLKDGSLDYLCHRGWPDDEMSDRLAVARASDFIQRAIADGNTINGFDPGETPPEAGPVVVCPLFDASGLVRALLCLDDIPVSRLNESTVTLFLGIAEWISASLTRLAKGENVQDPREAAIDPGAEADMWMGSLNDLGERLRLELERSSRYGVPASFLAVQAIEWKDTSRDGMDLVDRYVLTHFTGGLRPSDSLYRFGYPACYLLVLAGTTLEGAESVRARLKRRLDYSSRREVGRIDIFATGPDADAPDLVSLADRVARHFRSQSPLPLEGKCPVEVPREGKVGNIDRFLRRLKMEASLAARNGFDLHVVGISADVDHDAGREVLARHLRDAGDKVLRPTDGVFSIGPSHCAVILPSTGDEEAAMVAHRLVHAVRDRDPDAIYGDLETQVLGFGSTHPDATSFLEALARRRRGTAE